MRLALTLLVASLSASAIAQEVKEGWGLQFREEAFSGEIYPVAMISESGESFDRAVIGFSCGKNGNLVSLYQAGGFIVQGENRTVAFKGKQGIVEVTFHPGEALPLGKNLIADTKSTEMLIALFEAAKGADIPFRTDKNKQGVFSSVASAITFKLMLEHCPG